jgi:hypothetical protein
MSDKPKAKKDPFIYLPWAGLCVDPGLDPELFSRLPGHMQRERLFVRKMVEQRLPFTLEEYLRAGVGDKPETIEVSLPTGLTLRSLRARAGGTPVSGSMMQDLQAAVTDELLFQHCTALGEGRKLLTSKPTHGLYAYLWALVLVQKKVLSTLPLPYFWELEEGIHQITGRRLNVRTPAASPLFAWIDKRADFLASNVA